MKISELPVHLQYEITEVGVELSKLEDEINEKIDSGNLVDQMEIIEVSIERQRLIDDIKEKIWNWSCGAICINNKFYNKE